MRNKIRRLAKAKNQARWVLAVLALSMASSSFVANAKIAGPGTSTNSARVAAVNRLMSQLGTYDNLLKVMAVGVPYRDRQFISALRSQFGNGRLPVVEVVAPRQLRIEGTKIDIRDEKEQMFVVKGQVLYLKRNDSFRRRILWLQKNWFGAKSFAVQDPPVDGWGWSWMTFFPEAMAAQILAIESKMEKGTVAEALSPDGAFSLEDLPIINQDASSPAITALRRSVSGFAAAKIYAGTSRDLLTAMRETPALTGVIQLCDRNYGRDIKGLPVAFNCRRGGVQMSCSDGDGATKDFSVSEESLARYPSAKDVLALCQARSAELSRVQSVVAEIRNLQGIQPALSAPGQVRRDPTGPNLAPKTKSSSK